jgi:hypothetical protein
MSDEGDSPSRHYIECARRLRQLHALIRSGDGDSDQAEALRDEMDDYWIRMSSEERDWSGDLSADLHVLGENRPLLGDRPTDGVIRQQLLEAVRRDDWPALRSLLASDADSADLFDRFLFRAIYWAASKDYESSLEFLNFLADRMVEEQSSLETMQPGLDRLARVGKAADRIAEVRNLSRLALERIARISEEIIRLIVDVQSMGSSAVAAGADPTPWNLVKERFFLAEERLQAFSEIAA